MTVDREGRFPEFNWEATAGLWARKCAPLGQQVLRARAPFRTGAFRESIHDRAEITPGLAQVMFFSTLPYAGFITKGTGAHDIMPRNVGGVLRWLANSGHGPAQFATKVHHPGTKPNDFAETAMMAIGPAVAMLFADAVRESMAL